MNRSYEYDRPIPIAEGVYWVGFYEEKTNLHCNPYLIVEGDQAVLIDGGSRPDFAVVMMKILQAGLQPGQIKALIYQHYDPDLCGSMPNFVDIIDDPALKIIADPLDRIFLTYYLGKENHPLLRSVNFTDRGFVFNGRKLRFIRTPYCHNAGNFVTYDAKTKTLFSSDLFGSFSKVWDLRLKLSSNCYTCGDYRNCPNQREYCPLPDIIKFHRKIMPTGKALKYAMEQIRPLDIALIAPQHGGIISTREDIAFLIDKLANLERVGIDAYL